MLNDTKTMTDLEVKTHDLGNQAPELEEQQPSIVDFDIEEFKRIDQKIRSRAGATEEEVKSFEKDVPSM